MEVPVCFYFYFFMIFCISLKLCALYDFYGLRCLGLHCVMLDLDCYEGNGCVLLTKCWNKYKKVCERAVTSLFDLIMWLCSTQETFTEDRHLVLRQRQHKISSADGFISTGWDPRYFPALVFISFFVLFCFSIHPSIICTHYMYAA